MGSPFRYDRNFDFAISRDVLWDALNNPRHFPDWWPWLRSFTTLGMTADGLTVGSIADCVVRAPLPYTLEFRVHIERVDVGRSIDTHVSGDLHGPARLEVAGVGETATARLTWSVDVRVPMLSAASRVVRPALVWAHDRVVSNGFEQFRAHAFARPQHLD